MEQEIKEQEVLDVLNSEAKVLDLENEEDRKQIETELNSGSMYFRPESDVTYKVTLLSPKVEVVDKEFDGDHITKYALQIKAINKNGSEFEGIWEVGKSVLEPIFKNYTKDAVFKITKTGSGKETRYSVVADF